MRGGQERGAALIAVLWLSAILAAIAFSVATSVRGETERTSTLSDGVRAHYLAAGAIDRALAYIEWGPGHRYPDNTPRYYENGMARLNFNFPSGVATVQIMPESAKFDINTIQPADLFKLLAFLGADPGQAQLITAAIVDWRTAAPAPTPFDMQYLQLKPSFRARHASIEETEELLLVKGMTPELYHGGFVRDSSGRLQPRAGLKSCVSVYGSMGPFDVNAVEPAVMQTIGVPPPSVAAIVQRRQAMPFRQAEMGQVAAMAGPLAAGRLVIGGNTIFTLRSTARLRIDQTRLSDLTRTVSGLYKFNKPGYTPWIQVLRWYDSN